MKATIFLFIMAFTAFMPIVNYAQYYNPYNPYQQQQAMMDAYRAGQQMAKQYMQQQEQMLRSNPLQMWGHIVEEIATGYYEKAYEHLEYLADECEDGKACLYAGYMNELGLGTSRSLNLAKHYYKAGLNNGCKECKGELNRFNEGNRLGKSFKATFIGYFQNINAMCTTTTSSFNIGNNSSSSSNSSRHRSGSGTCSSCGGTGVCPTPNSGGSLTSFVAHYNSPNNKCPYCGKYTAHFHDRCYSCNVPTY